MTGNFPREKGSVTPMREPGTEEDAVSSLSVVRAVCIEQYRQDRFTQSDV